MATCNLTAGIPRGCRDSSGGAYSFYIADYVTGTTTSTEYLTKDGEGIVTSFSGTSTSIPGFYEFTPNKNSASFTEEYAISLENGTKGYTQKAEGSFAGLTQAKQTLINNLASGNFIVVVKDKNAKFWLLGENDAAVLASGSGGSGKVLSDLNGYTLVMQAEEGSPAAEVDSAAVILL